MFHYYSYLVITKFRHNAVGGGGGGGLLTSPTPPLHRMKPKLHYDDYVSMLVTINTTVCDSLYTSTHGTTYVKSIIMKYLYKDVQIQKIQTGCIFKQYSDSDLASKCNGLGKIQFAAFVVLCCVVLCCVVVMRVKSCGVVWLLRRR